MGVEEEQQESRGVCVGVQTADGQVVANGEVTANNSVAVGEEKEPVANPSNWVVGRAFAQRLRASRKYQSASCSPNIVLLFEVQGRGIRGVYPTKTYKALVGKVKTASGKENPILASRSEDEPFVPPVPFVQFE